jgi:sugar phosphate permease
LPYAKATQKWEKMKSTIIFIICYLAYTLIYVARLNLSMASPGLINSQVIYTAQVGMLSSNFTVIYAFSRLLNGGLSDKLPPCVMISSGLVIAGIIAKYRLSLILFPSHIGKEKHPDISLYSHMRQDRR